MGDLTNTQAAYRLPQHHDDFLRRLNQRAADLWSDGYRAQATDLPPVFLVFQECEGEAEPTGYQVDPLAQTCTCAFFRKQATEPLTEDGTRLPCKHLLGLQSLVQEELAYWTMKRDWTRDPLREAGYQTMIDALTEAWTLVGK